MKPLNLAIVVVVTAFGALLMVDGIMTSLGNELFALPVFKGIVGFIFVLVSGLFLRKVQVNEE